MGLFDIFGKKNIENAGEEGSVKLGVPNIPEEKRKMYEDQVHEFLVIVGGGSSGASRIGKGADYSVSIPILGYIDLTGGKRSNTRASLSYVVAEKDYDRNTVFGLFEKEKSYRIKGLAAKEVDEGPEYINNPYRLGGIYILELLEKDIKDEYLDNLLSEFNKPVIFISDVLGNLNLDKELGWLEGKSDWLGADAEIHVNVEEDLSDAEDGIKNLEEFYKNRKEWDSKLRAYAAKELIDSANDWINSDNFEEEEIVLTEEEFADRIGIESVDVNADGNFTVMYDDDDIFAGHVVVVEGNMEDGPDSAYIEG